MQREFVDGVAAAGAQHPEGLGHDLGLGAIGLHGEHGLADGDVHALVVEAGCRRVAGYHAAAVAHHTFGETGCGRIGFDSDVTPGGAFDDRRRSLAETGCDLEDVGSGEVGVVEQAFGEFAAAGAEHALAEAGEQPVARQILGLATGKGKCVVGRLAGHRCSSDRRIVDAMISIGYLEDNSALNSRPRGQDLIPITYWPWPVMVCSTCSRPAARSRSTISWRPKIR